MKDQLVHNVLDELGRAPASWRRTRLKYIAEFFTGWTPPSGDDSLYDGDLPWANIGDLGAANIGTTARTISHRAVHVARLRVSPRGSLLFSFKLSVGLVSIAEVDLYTNEAIATLTPGPDLDVKYCYWAAPYFLPRNANENIYGAKLLNRDLMRSATWLLPPLKEQRAIAALLDRETAKIDALVTRKERLLELLDEKRTALITRAVTKGLDPGAPMKDSGVEWMGEVPARWDVERLKHICTIENSGTYGQEEGEGDVDLPVCTTAHITRAGQFQIDDMPLRSFSRAEAERYTGRPGDLFIVKSSGSNTNIISGKLALVRERTPAIVFSNFLMRIRPSVRRVVPAFVAYVLNSDLTRKRIHRMVATTTYPNIDVPEYAGSPLPVPPMREQEDIVAYLDSESLRVDTLSTRLIQAIAVLREYRTALISAAVTGQIDVTTLGEPHGAATK